MSAVLFDIGHPAHVHLFRNFIHYLKEAGHLVVVVSRDKDITNILLEHYKIDFVSLSKATGKSFPMLKELVVRDFRVYKTHRKFRFDLAFGTSVSIAHLSAISRIKSYVFEEDDDNIVPVFSLLTYPFTTGVVIPSSLKYERWRKKRIVHNSYHELAYLHPDNFSPDVEVLRKYKLKPYDYVLVRHSALKAHHDKRIKGLTEKAWARINELLKDYRIISSRENLEKKNIDPWDMHHVLAFSKILISDSQTMTMEAGVLGVPSIRYNSFVGRISVLEELEQKYQLTSGFLPGQEEQMLDRIDQILKDKGLLHQFASKREGMLREKVDFTGWMIKFFKSIS